MLAVLGNLTYRRLFLAQLLSLLGSGLTTVALGLAAFEIAGAEAGVVLGGALALKMAAYVGLAPLAAALAERAPRKAFLVGLDVARVCLTAMLPFVDAVWQIYALVFAYQACSAAFTPAFQALIPDVLTEEKAYSRALSLSRLAYDLESLLSPLIAGALLTVLSFSWLFAGTALGFAASALLVLGASLPERRAAAPGRSFQERASRGARIYLATPRLRGMLALYLAVSAGLSMVIVNTVVLVKEVLGGDDALLALFFVASGGGSMLVALALPKILDAVPQRPVMLAGGAALSCALLFGATGLSVGSALLVWFALGAAGSAVQTPSGLVLRRSSSEADRTSLFAAQFALSHACWLAAYPAAGMLGAAIGLPASMAVMAAVAATATAAAAFLWPADDPQIIAHTHEGEEAQAHLAAHGGGAHAHVYVIDDLHPRWPSAPAQRS